MLRHRALLGAIAALLFCGCGLPNPLGGNKGKTYEFAFADYQVAIRDGHPFGIVDLKLKDQTANFANAEKPLGDWEWFWFEHPEDGRQRRVKLVYPGGWSGPVVAEGDSAVVLHFVRRDVLERGIELEVEFTLQRQRPALQARYTVSNGSALTLQRPYVMIGFPGFANHRRISAVVTEDQRRLPQPPHTDFRAEVRQLRLRELLLLRRDLPRFRTTSDTLRARLELAEGSRFFELHAAAVLETTYTEAYSAHTIKPRYLTSHLYAFSSAMPPGSRRSLVVQHQLQSRAAGP